MKLSDQELQNLNQEVHTDGLIRAHGRLVHVKKLTKPARCLIIIKGSSSWATLFIHHVHGKVFHHMVGAEQTLAEVRRVVWITKGRETVCKILRQCVHCHRLRSSTATQQMGPLSSIRVPDEDSYAFKFTAIDAAGPFLTKMPWGYTRRKCYLLVFTCWTFRCVHLDVLNGLDAHSFLLTFEHFLAR